MPNKKGSRRGNDEGSIVWREDRQQWYARVNVGNKPASKYSKSKTELQTWIRSILNQRENGTYIQPSKLLLKEWLDTWLNVTMKNSIKDTTFLSYQAMIDKHIIPGIGDIKLMELQTKDIQKLYNDCIANGRADKVKNKVTGEMEKKQGGLAPKTVRYIHTILHSSLDQAVKEKLISNNASEAVKLPKNPKKEMKVLEIKSIEIFLNTAKTRKHYQRYYPAYLLELYTGMRRGELLGIRWKDCNFKENKIKIVQQLVKVGTENKIRELKTESSQNRVISIPDEVVMALKEHKANQTGYLKDIGYNDIQIKEHLNSGLMFISETGGLIQPRNFVRNFKGCLKTAKLPEVRFHDMRHTFALLTLQAGGDIKTLQNDLGHESIQTTLDKYGHVNMDMKVDAANKRSSLLKACIKE